MTASSYHRASAEGAPNRSAAGVASGIVGAAPPFRRALTAARRAAACAAPVVVHGETGTGKELIARLIHSLSDRTKKGFVPVNCGCLPADLVENELFGHAAGAFTGAQTASTGLVHQADGGALFLDEVDTLAPRAQVALLRFLQQGEVRQVGSGRTRNVNCRVIAAANRSLHELVGRGDFRQDLFFRLNVLEVSVPPLRARREDLPALARHFLSRFGKVYRRRGLTLSEAAMQWILEQDWPGNVRQLENVIHRAILSTESDVVPLKAVAPDAGPAQRHCDKSTTARNLFTMCRDAPSAAPGQDGIEPFASAKAKAIAEWELRYLTRLMDSAAGNVTAAAELAGKERRALGKLLKKHGLSGGAQQDHSGSVRPLT